MKPVRLAALAACPLLVALTACLLLVAGPAEARKRCRPVEPAQSLEEEAAAEEADDWPHATSAWVHEADAGWVHEGADPGWVHGGADRDWVHADATGAWVHDTDYGWWAAVPAAIEDAAAAGDAGAEDEELLEQDCTVSRRRNECVVLANQIAIYELRLGLARERDDAVWEDALEGTIERLEARGARRACAWVEPSMREKVRQTVEAVARAVGVASQVAATLYRLGLF